MREPDKIDVVFNTRTLVDRWINDIANITQAAEDALMDSDQGDYDPMDREATRTLALTARERLIFQRINDALSGATLERREFTLGDVHFIGETLVATGDDNDLQLGTKVMDFIPAARELGIRVNGELIPVILTLAEWAIVDEKAPDYTPKGLIG